MKNNSCKICNVELEVEARCKRCNKPTRLFCHVCGIVREKESHPKCMMNDLATLIVRSRTHN